MRFGAALPWAGPAGSVTPDRDGRTHSFGCEYRATDAATIRWRVTSQARVSKMCGTASSTRSTTLVSNSIHSE